MQDQGIHSDGKCSKVQLLASTHALLWLLQLVHHSLILSLQTPFSSSHPLSGEMPHWNGACDYMTDNGGYWRPWSM